LQTGELLNYCAGLQIVAFEEGFVSNPDRVIQRVVAIHLQSGLEGAALSRILVSP
jgi:hypothetical protein